MLASLEFRLEIPGPGFGHLGPVPLSFGSGPLGFGPGFGLLTGFPLGVGPVPLSVDLGFSLLAGFLLRVGPVPLVSEPGDVPSGGRVIPAELSIFPAQVQVQRLAVSLVSPVVNPFDGDRLVNAVNQPVAGQGRPVMPPAGVVEAPVFRDAQGGIAIPLFGDVPSPSGARGDFQDEVRGLALLLDDVAVRSLPPSGSTLKAMSRSGWNSPWR